MDNVFAAALAEWSTFYAFVGGAAATLLGLLFVAVSLRLDIFRRREVADVRDFAAVTFASFLAALVVAGLALAPHQRWPTLALPLLALGLLGLAVVGYLVREWLRLNPRGSGFQPGFNPGQWQGWAYLAGLVVVALLLWGGRAGALVGLAVVEGGVLVMATASAWLLLTRTGASADG